MKRSTAWKYRERSVALFFGTRRNAYSGSKPGITGSRADTLDAECFVEVKTRERHAVVTLWRKVAAKARVEEKIPVIALAENEKQGFFLLVAAADLDELINILAGRRSKPKNMPLFTSANIDRENDKKSTGAPT